MSALLFIKRWGYQEKGGLHHLNEYSYICLSFNSHGLPVLLFVKQCGESIEISRASYIFFVLYCIVLFCLFACLFACLILPRVLTPAAPFILPFFNSFFQLLVVVLMVIYLSWPARPVILKQCGEPIEMQIIVTNLGKASRAS